MDKTLGKFTIRTNSAPCLRKKSLPIKTVGPSERLLMDAMLETMYAVKGIGLAAPQVGINQQIFVIDIGEGPLYVANPQILKRSGSEGMEEGCLSLPGKVVTVRRPKTIRVKFLDQNNQPAEKIFSGLLARAFLHENDHLLGKLIIDYRTLGEKLGIKKPAKKKDTHEAVI